MTSIQFPNQFLGPGTLDVVVVDNNGAPATVLEASQDFTIEASWQIDAISALLLGGQWEIAAYVESIGEGPEKQIGQTEVRPLTGGTGYSATITVPANELPDNPSAPVSGVYKLVTVLTHRNFNLLTNVAAVAEGPIVRIG